MKILKVFLISSFLLSFGSPCSQKDPDDEANANQVKYGLLMYLFENYHKTTTQYIDNKDGTISVYEVYQRDGSRGKLLKTIKKCLQNQVYRQAENDCKGIGTETNYYGASLLQFCDKQDNSCTGGDRYGQLDGNGNSEVFISCANETFLNKKWSVHSGYIGPYSSESVYSHFKIGTEIWYNRSYGDIYGDVFLWGYNDRRQVLKTEKYYVLCSI